MYPRSPLASIQKFHQELTTLRRDLHANPELGFQEIRTASIVAGALDALGIEVHRGVGRTGVVGVIRGQRHDSGRSIGIRGNCSQRLCGRNESVIKPINQLINTLVIIVF